MTRNTWSLLLNLRSYAVMEFEYTHGPQYLESVVEERSVGTNRKLDEFIQEDREVPSTSCSTNNTNTGNQTGKGHDKGVGADQDEGGKENKKKRLDQTSSIQQVENDTEPDPSAMPSHLEGIDKSGIVSNNQSLRQILLNLSQDMKLVKQIQLDMLRNQNQPAQQQNPPNGQVEIGHPGSKVFVNQQQWDTATAQNSYTTMGISLVQALFEKDVLLASNLRGGSSRTDKNAARRPGLNSVILEAIDG
ncbi:hypothetical protein KQX54_016795 [Cotesia glomerata]|uniref:BEN domain-containing protein n=1 Tax=Cotesia glomerata TaxID=32391 RepID=A0AAV7IRF2_COTGL|nr:hypothetical protein KQX54_016795 [Cotesia glomerata]